MKGSKKFLIELGIVTVILISVLLIIDSFQLFQLHPHTWWVLLYNILLSFGSYLMVRKGMQGNPYDFQNYFMGNITIRLLLSATLMLIYFLNVKENRLDFIITFFVFYFIYTVFEIKSLLANLRSNSERVDKKDEKHIQS